MSFTFADPAFIGAAGSVGFMTPALVQGPNTAYNALTAGPIATTFTTPAVAGNILQVTYAVRSNTAAPVTPAGYTLVHSLVDANGSLYFYVATAAGGETSVSVAYTDPQICHLFVREFSGVTSTVEGAPTSLHLGTSAVTTITAPAITTAAPALLLAGVILFGTSGAGGISFAAEALTNNSTTNQGAHVGRLPMPAAGTYATTASWVTARRAGIAMMALRAKAA